LLAVADEKPAVARKISRDEREYTRLLELYLGPCTAFLILLCCLMMKIPGGEDIADHLAMDQTEQEMVIGPLARLLDKQHLGAKAKAAVLNSGDALGLILGLGSYGLRVAGALKTLQRGDIAHVNRQYAQEQASPANNGYGHASVAGLAQYAAD